MNWILGCIIIFLVIILSNRFLVKRKQKILKKRLIANWGNPKSEYFNFQLIEKYFRNNKKSENSYQTISDSTWNDLDFNEVFKYIDRTSSKIGQQYLYYKLRTIASVSGLKKFELLTKKFSSDASLRRKAQLHLSELASSKSFYLEELFHSEKVEKSNKIWLIYFLSIASILSIIFTFFYPIISLLLIPIFILNMILHYKNKNKIQYYLEGVGQLAIGYKVAVKLLSLNGIASFFRNADFKNIKTILIKTQFIEWERKLDNEYAFVFWFISEVIKITFNLELIVFYSFQSSIEKEKDNIERLFIFLGEIDSAISCASVFQENTDICAPDFIPNKQIVVEGIYHPLVKNCVPNNLSLVNSSLLLTGSNMSGKTTFIRTFTINAILAQTIYMCFAEKYKAPFFKIYSSIRISDDLINDTSYYLQEVIRIKDLVKVSQDDKPCLLVLDEIFKGTNTVERIAAGNAILKYLNKGKSMVMVSTHDIELTDLLRTENYDLYHFTESIEENKLIFDHKLKPGKLKSRNAIKILELYEYPVEIIKESKRVENSNEQK